MKKVKRLAKEYISITHRHRQQCVMVRGKVEWGLHVSKQKGVMGTSIILSTIKLERSKKKSVQQFKGCRYFAAQKTINS